MTLPSTKYQPNDHTEEHSEAIRLALAQVSGELVALLSIERESGPTAAGSGNNACWQYVYGCTLSGAPDEPADATHACLAVLFAQYREK